MLRVHVMHTGLPYSSAHTDSFRLNSPLCRSSHCGTFIWARIPLRYGASHASGSLCRNLPVFSGHGEQAAIEEEADEGEAGKIDAERPGSLRIAAAAEAVNGGKGEDEQRENVQ